MEDREQIYQDVTQRYRETIRKGQKAYRNNVMKGTLEDIKSGAIAVDEAMKIFDEIGLPELKLDLPNALKNELDVVKKEAKTGYWPELLTLSWFFGLFFGLSVFMAIFGDSERIIWSRLIISMAIFGILFAITLAYDIRRFWTGRKEFKTRVNKAQKNLQLAIEAITKIIPYQKDPT